MRTTSQIEEEIKKITSLIVESSDEAILKCIIDGTASGISAAFIDALDRADPSGVSSESLHELLVEYANSFASETQTRIPGSVTLAFRFGQTSVSVED